MATRRKTTAIARRQLTLSESRSAPKRDSKRVAVAKKKLKHALQLKRQASKLYKKAESLLDDAVEELGVGATIELRAGRVAIIVDNFARRNVFFKRIGCNRFDVEIMD